MCCEKKGADSWPNHWSIKNDWQPNPLSFMTCTSYSAPSWVWLLDSPLDPQRWVDGRHGKPDGKQATTGRSKTTKTPFFLATFGHHFGERIKGRIGNISLWMNCHTGQGATGKGFCMDRDQAVLHCETCQGVAISEGLCFNSLNSPAQGRFRDMSEMPRQNASPTKVYKAVQLFNSCSIRWLLVLINLFLFAPTKSWAHRHFPKRSNLQRIVPESWAKLLGYRFSSRICSQQRLPLQYKSPCSEWRQKLKKCNPERLWPQ